jgi:nitroimidazol reductase NimA-like FMN-containing flavoprotein (pyridoxamine 5'-phosphate oxidase superfamily)
MTDERDLAAIARTIIDSNRYMTLATADERGTPWASPVWYAPAGYREYLWVSDPGARHCRNIATRPEVGIVIFDSHVPGAWQSVYVAALAEELAGAELEQGVEVFSSRSVEQDLPGWTREDVQPPARHRLYRATASEHYVLTDQDRRLPVSFE